MYDKIAYKIKDAVNNLVDDHFIITTHLTNIINLMLNKLSNLIYYTAQGENDTHV